MCVCTVCGLTLVAVSYTHLDVYKRQVQADVGLQAQAGRGAGGGDAERAFAVRRTAAFVQGGVGARRRGGVPVRGFCGMVD